MEPDEQLKELAGPQAIAGSIPPATSPPLPDFSERERLVLDFYRTHSSGNMFRLIRQSIFFALSTAAFTSAAIISDEPWMAAGTNVLVVAFLLIRIRTSRLSVDIMPGILAKYEKAVTDLQARSPSPIEPPHGCSQPL